MSAGLATAAANMKQQISNATGSPVLVESEQSAGPRQRLPRHIILKILECRTSCRCTQKRAHLKRLMMAGTSGLADWRGTATRFGSSFDDDYCWDTGDTGDTWDTGDFCWDTGDTSSARNHQPPLHSSNAF